MHIKQTAHISKGQFNQYIQVYTDASKSGTEDVGAAYYIPEKDIPIEFRLENHVTTLTAELAAIRSAIQFIYQQQYQTACNIDMFTDSLSSITSIESAATSAYISLETDIIDLITKLHEKQNISTTIVWIPSHVGITANEQVDKLAELGTTKPTATTINSDIQLYANQRDIQQEIDQQIEEE
jgi:ribonuclease HI